MKVLIDNYDNYKDNIVKPPKEDPNNPIPEFQLFPYEYLRIRDLVFAGLKRPINSIDLAFITFDALLESNKVIRFGIPILLTNEEKQQFTMDDVIDSYDDISVRGIGDLEGIDQYSVISGFRKDAEDHNTYKILCKKKGLEGPIYPIYMDKISFIMIMNVQNKILELSHIPSCTAIMDDLRFLRNTDPKFFKISDFGISVNINNIYIPAYKSSLFKKSPLLYRIYVDILFKKPIENSSDYEEVRVILDMIIDSLIYKKLKLKWQVKTIDELKDFVSSNLDVYTVTQSTRVDFSIKANTPMTKTLIICQNNNETKNLILEISGQLYEQFTGDLYNKIIELAK